MLLERFLHDLTLEGGKELFLSAVDRLHNTYKSKEDWKKLFVETGEFFIDYENNAEKVFDDLSIVLSKTNMEKIANELSKESGYELKDRLLYALIKLMDKYDIPHDIAYSYSYRILDVILSEIHRIAPVKYDQHYQSEWRKEQQEAFAALKKQIEVVRDEMKKFDSMELGIHSAIDMELKLKRATDNPRIGISFFAIDDDSFKEAFSERVNDNVVYIKSRSREETIYCLINELWKNGDQRAVFIVDTNNDWEKLAQISNSGNIYIPNFLANEITPIPNNTNIFIFIDGFPSFSDDEIELRPRTYNTLLNALQNAGMAHEKAYELINETHGIYAPLKKKIFKSAFLNKPCWTEELPERVKVTALLLGQWTDLEGDKAIAEELSGVKFEDFIALLRPYSKGEDPFIHIYSRSSNNTYMLASADVSWSYFDYIGNEIWDDFIQLFIMVINEYERLFVYPHKERLIAQFKGEKLSFSSALRNGMIRSVIYRGIIKNEPSYQRELDQITKRIIDYIHTEDQWRYFADYFSSFCEISPSVMLQRLQSEIDNPTGLLALFEKQSDNFLFEKNPYISILWGAEQFLTQEKYFSEGLKWFLRLDDKGYEYNSNNPRDSLIKVFCTWYNFSSITTVGDKAHFAELAFEIDDNAWDIIYESLPYYHRSIIGKLSYPRYRPHDNESSVINRDLYQIVSYYISLLVGNICNRMDRWIKLIDIADEMNLSDRNMVLESLSLEITHLTDDSKLILFNHIRESIYKHRYFSSASWAGKEDVLSQYESILKQIVFDSPEYGYVYLFKPDGHGVLLDPIPYDSKNDDENDKRINTVVSEQLQSFRSKELSLELLADLCGRENNTVLGKDLALYWDNMIFNSDTYTILYRAQQSKNMALEYFNQVVVGDRSCFEKVIELNEYLHYEDGFAAKIYKIQAHYADSVPEIDKASEKIKRLFWRDIFISDKIDYKWTLNSCKDYGNINSYIGTLYYINERLHLDKEELLVYFVMISDLPICEVDSMFSYYMKKLLGILDNEFILNKEIRYKLAIVEMSFSQLLDWADMKSTQYEFKSSPEMYAELVRIVFKTDDGTTNKTECDKERATQLYSFFEKTKFCPCEDEGCVDESSIELWVENFKSLLETNNQKSLFGFLLGRLLSYSPPGTDGYYPCEAVRKVIEDNFDKELKDSYQTEIFNRRGVYSPSAGKEELKIAKRFKENADYLMIQYPHTASIYEGLYRRYCSVARREREDAENGQF